MMPSNPPILPGNETVDEDEWIEQYKRNRGIFTDADRKYLNDVQEYSHDSTESERKSDYRDRVAHAIVDFGQLHLMTARDREKIKDRFERSRLDAEFADMYRFMYIMLDGDLDRMEDIAQFGLRAGYRDLHADPDGELFYDGGPDDVNAEYDIEPGPSRTDALEKLDQGKYQQLSGEELHALAVFGDLDEEDLEALKDPAIAEADED